MRKLTLGSAIKITGCLLTKTTVAMPSCSGLEYGGCLVTKSCLTLATPQTVVWQAPLSMGFSRQEYWSGLPFPSPGDLPHPGIKPGSPVFEGRFLTTEPPWIAFFPKTPDLFLMSSHVLKNGLYDHLLFLSSFTFSISYPVLI